MLERLADLTLRLRIWIVRFRNKHAKFSWGRMGAQIVDDDISKLTLKIDVNFRKEISITIFDPNSDKVPQLLFDKNGKYIGTHLSLTGLGKKTE